MSINHFLTGISENTWWALQQNHPIMEPNPNPNSSSFIFPSHNTAHLNFNLNTFDSDGLVDKEPMFEKPLTPSDVGKLNRLVIPKQHAEKYFPLGGGGGGADSADKGLLLSFEDESGKCWRFRYSYWNSSQSYVLTKGWSRYVKEKQLDAGDVVLFERHRADADRLFIGWRRRGGGDNSNSNNTSCGGVQGSTGGAWSRGLYSSSSTSPFGQQHSHGGGGANALGLHAESGELNQQAMPVANSKTFRLFGVNLECQPTESEPSTPDDGSLLSSQGAHLYLYSQSAHSPNSQNRMEMSLSEEMMRNRRG